MHDVHCMKVITYDSLILVHQLASRNECQPNAAIVTYTQASQDIIHHIGTIFNNMSTLSMIIVIAHTI